MIQDKVVCDVGCRAGNFMKVLGKYAKHVVGIESNARAIQVGRERGNEIIDGDAAEIMLPEADVYYIWVTENQLPRVLRNVRKQVLNLNLLRRPECEAKTLYD